MDKYKRNFKIEEKIKKYKFANNNIKLSTYNFILEGLLVLYTSLFSSVQ